MILTGLSTVQSYPVHIESGCSTRIPELFPEWVSHRRLVIITDREVAGFHLARFQQQFAAIGLKVPVITIDGSEAGKNLDSVKAVIEQISDCELTREDCLLALGGGSVIDVTAFTAAIYLGGIQYIQIPTSLLAMIDSSINPSCSLNFRSSKNLIGTNSHPFSVLVDPDYLRTLPAKHLANGFAQMIQYGYLYKPELIRILEENAWNMDDLIAMSVRTKIELHRNQPEYLGFGQPIGNAIEGHFRFLKYLHGEALALGMLAAAPSERLRALLQQFHLPTQVEGVAPDTLVKKAVRICALDGHESSVVRVSEPGSPRLVLVPSAEIEAVIAEMVLSIDPREATRRE